MHPWNGVLVLELASLRPPTETATSLHPESPPWVLELSDPAGQAWEEAAAAALRAEVSTNLLDWTALDLDRLWTNGRLRFADPTFGVGPRRFYRGVSP